MNLPEAPNCRSTAACGPNRKITTSKGDRLFPHQASWVCTLKSH